MCSVLEMYLKIRIVVGVEVNPNDEDDPYRTVIDDRPCRTLGVAF